MTDNNARGTLINQVGAVFVPVADQRTGRSGSTSTRSISRSADFIYGESAGLPPEPRADAFLSAWEV